MVAYAVMFFVPLVNVRALTVSDYSYYRQFWLLYETMFPLLTLAFPRGLLYHLPRAESREEKSAYITQAVLFLSFTAFLGAVAYAVMAKMLGQGLGSAARAFFWRLAFFTFFMATTDFMEIIFIAEKRNRAQAVYHVTIWSVQSIVVMTTSWLTRDVNLVIWALSFFGMARFLFVITYLHTTYGLTLKHVSLRSITDQLSFALPVGFAAVSISFLGQTDKFVITHYLGREAFAIYAVGAFQVPLMNIVRASISNVTFPMLVKYEKEGNHAAMLDLWQRSLYKIIILIFPVFVFLEISARPFITILFTEKYEAATPVFMLYLLLFLRSSFESTVLQAYKRTRFILITSLVGFAINLAMGIGLFKVMGRLGVPLSIVITMNLINLVSLWYSGKLMHASLFQVLPIPEITKRFLAAAIPGVGLWIFYRHHPVSTLPALIVACAAYTAVYAAICWVTKLVTMEDLRALLGRSRVNVAEG